jgi:hypothetical protein
MYKIHTQRSVLIDPGTSGQVAYSVKVPLPEINLAPIIFMAGPVPIVLVPQIEPEISISLGIGGGFVDTSEKEAVLAERASDLSKCLSDKAGVEPLICSDAEITSGSLISYKRGVNQWSDEGSEYLDGSSWHKIKAEEKEDTGNIAKISLLLQARASAGVRFSIISCCSKS